MVIADVPHLEVIERTVPVVDNRFHDASPEFIVTQQPLRRFDCGWLEQRMKAIADSAGHDLG
jgi:hypothetical protein